MCLVKIWERDGAGGGSGGCERVGVIAKDGMDDVEVVGMGDRGGLSVAVDRVDVDVGRISVESCEVDGDACE